MSNASAASSIPAFSPKLLVRFVESLRRDAFIMEAYNYGSPAIADNEDFKLALRPLAEQARILFGDQTMVVAAVDADGCWDRETETKTRQALVGLVHPEIDVRVWPKRIVESSDAVPKLADCIIGGKLIDFWSKVDVEANQFFAEKVKQNADDQVIIAPYLVRPCHEEALTAKDGKFRQLVDLWQQRGDPDFVFTQPFCGSPGDRLTLFANAYYAAVLVVYIPPEIRLTQAHMNWLEAFHISFQTAWGFAALEEAKRDLETKRQEAEEIENMRKQVRTFQALQILAHGVSETIHEDLTRMRRKLDPGFGLETEELATLFDPDRNRVWRGADITVLSQHDWEACDSENCEAVKHFAVHRIFDDFPSSKLKFQELKQSTERLVAERTQHSPVLAHFLAGVLEEGQNGFDLLKGICRINMSGDKLRFYALATWFFLGQVSDNFTIRVESGESSADLAATTFLHPATQTKWLASPMFPEKSGTKPKAWARPLLNLVRELQLEHGPVSVSSVTLVDAEPRKIICKLQGEEVRINEVIDFLTSEPSHDISKHGLRTTLSRLHEARAALSKRFFTWDADKTNKQITFKIGFPT